MDFNRFQWILMDFNGFQWISMDFNQQTVNLKRSESDFGRFFSHPTLNTNMIREDLTRSHPRSPQETVFKIQRRPFGKNREAGLVYHLYIANLRYPAQKKTIFAG